MRSSYNTRQREEILQCIEKLGHKHFTAGDIIEALEKSGKQIGSATVYRMIDRMAESGRIRKFIIDGSTSACYQLEGGQTSGKCENHFHLKCLLCERLFHVDCDHIAELSGHIAKNHGFDIDMSKTVLYGICEDCKNGEKKIKK